MTEKSTCRSEMPPTVCKGSSIIHLDSLESMDFISYHKKKNFMDGTLKSKPGIHNSSCFSSMSRRYWLMIFLAIVSQQHLSHAEPTGISSQKDWKESHERGPILFELKDRALFLSKFLPQHQSYIDDILDQDADADDDDDNGDDEDYNDHGYNDNGNDDAPTGVPATLLLGNETMSNSTKVNMFANYTKCRWYTLSHYISPDSMLYDGIEGFLIAMLLCLIFGSCFSYCSYCCGCVPDDRVYKSLLNRKGRKMRIKSRNQKPSGCCRRCCCFGLRGRSSDGKGIFMPIETRSSSMSSDDDKSSVSLDSALSLEYGDNHLHNEYGEITSRWDDDKIEAAAREYFSREEKESEKKNKKSQKIGVSFKNKAEKKGGRSIRSSASRSRKRSKKMRRGGGSITLSQASSILSSSSEYSLSSGDSSSSGTINELEMEAAMMDLELVKRSIAEKGYV